ncbi:MAG: tripartite tricarboxylate transporter substrate binding protein, partial [Oscillospiraceae bacterium]
MKKKIIVGLLLLVSLATAGFELYGAVTALTSDYPENDINGYIAWGAGGATDTISRTICVLAEQELDTSIILQNKTGASGGIATEFVERQKPDGYSLLFNAENPPLYGVMDISNCSYEDYYPVLLFGSQTAVIVVAPDSPYQSVTDLIKDAKSRPGEVTIGITGAGGLPFNVAAMFRSTSGIEFSQVPFAGDADILTAVMGKHVEVSVANYSAVAELSKAGLVRVLTVMANEPLKAEPEVEVIGDVLPEYQKYFPWGAFFGVFVDDRCPDKVKATLTDAFLKAYNSDEFQTYLNDNYVMHMGLSGEEARSYIRRWQSVSAWLLADAGAAVVPPAELGIPRIEELEG